jgi:hypothetical protein
MATVIGANREEFILKEMARRAGRKYEPDEPKNPYEGLSVDELKAQKALIRKALKENDDE